MFNRKAQVMLRNITYSFTHFLCAFFLFISFSSKAQQSFFELESRNVVNTEGARIIIPNKYQVAQVSHTDLTNFLFAAPHETQVSAKNSGYMITLPMPNGTTMNFSIVESPIFEDGLAAKFPNIKTFLGQGVEDRTATVRLDISPSGFHAMIRSKMGTVFIDPYSQHNTQYAISYFKRDFQKQGESTFTCKLEDTNTLGIITPLAPQEDLTTTPPSIAVPTGTELRKYRLALAATGEYTTFHGGTVPLALAAMTTTINRVNEIYEADLAVRLILVSNTNTLIETNSATDPYTNGTTNLMITEAQTEITAAIGSTNFDIGHLFGTDSGGLAGLGVVCSNSNKARGVTGSSAPTGDPFDIDYVSHEVGHQFGASHTQNNTCNRALNSAYEPGSASTIMGYAGICAPNLQNNSDAIFHSHSYDQIQTHIDGTTCAVIELSTNNVPDANAGTGGYTIPVSTPFELTGSATDVDGDILTYTWEQFDLGPSTTTLTDLENPTANEPIFRVWAPTTNATRVFPRLVDLVNNTTSIGEMLPTYTRSMNFRFVVRDNNAGTGGFDYDNLSLNVAGTAGPFIVEDLNGGEVVAENELVTINWDVANTDIAPVNCSHVTITLSTDGGFTYPTTLAFNVPNNGTSQVLIPIGVLPTGITSSTTCRIKIKADNNVFFDISDNNFTVTEPTTPDFVLNPDDNTFAICAPGFAIDSLEVEQILGFSNDVQLSATGVPAGATFTFGDTLVAPGTTTSITFEPNTITPGDYLITITGTDDTITHTTDIIYQVANSLPTTSILTFPLDDATDIPEGVNFMWDPVNFIQSYTIEISTDSTFATLFQTGTSTENNYFPSPILEIDTEYFWRVKSQNACGFSLWSDTLSFTTTDIPAIYGCTDPTAFNYDPAATEDDGSCEPEVIGCTNPDALNFNANANVDDGSCLVMGCTDSTAINYDPNANIDNGNCIIHGCTDATAFNYNPNASFDDGSCEEFAYGCTDPTALNFDPNANTDNGFCVEEIFGCTDSTAFNYDPAATIYNGTCIFLPSGCTDSTYNNYDPLAGIDDGSCSNDIVFLHYEQLVDSSYNFWITAAPGVSVLSVTWAFGDSTGSQIGNPLGHIFAENGTYHIEAHVSTSIPNAIYYADTLLNLEVWGCTDPYAANFNWNATSNDNSCIDAIYGCIDSLANNFNAGANISDGSCMFDIYGCTDQSAINYSSNATIDDGSCITTVLGCTDSTAANYNANANVDDGSCITNILGCTDPTAWNYNPTATVDDGSCITVVLGCTDSTALNFESLANTNDGSCEYTPATDSIWDVTATSENHTILIPTNALMDINGDALANGDYVGVFYDQNGLSQCGGFIIWNGANATITAYGAEDGEDNGFQDGESFVWKVFDISTLATLNAEVSYDINMPNEGEYADDGISAIESIDASNGQSIDMVNGWNFVSTYIDPNDADISVSMAPIANDIFLAKDENGSVYWPAFNINNIGDLTIGKAYKVKMDADATWNVEGSVVDPTNHSLTLDPGWSYLGYLRTHEAIISSALADITANIWLVKDAEGNVYWPQFNINNIGNMEPGEGYQINMNNQDILTYASNSTTLATAKLAGNITPSFYSKPLKTGSNMTIALPLNVLEGMAMEGDEIAAFNEKGQLIGSSVYQGAHTALTIWGDDSSTELVENISANSAFSLKLWNAENQVEYLLEIELNTGDAIYSKDGISIVTNLRKSILMENWSSSIFPNPANNELSIQIFNPEGTNLSIAVYNQLGIKVIDLSNQELSQGQNNLSIDVQGLTNGLYYILLEDQLGHSSKESISIIH